MFLNQIVLFSVLGLLLNACEADQKSVTGLPLLEPTSFSSLENSVSQGLKEIDQVEEDLAAGKQKDAQKNLLKVRTALLELKYYFIPMTQVRQVIYDAGHLQATGRQLDALAHLARADRLLGDIETHGIGSFHKALQELRVMIEKLRETLEQERQTTSNKDLADLSKSAAAQFSELGHKANMMVIKGDLILSGVDFIQTNQGNRGTH
jgi:hypothetical protein